MKWDSGQYWLKSRTFQSRASDPARPPAERSFWRALALELLMRAALTRVHPALNADPQNEGLHLLYAFGIPVKGEPRSIPIHAVSARLQRIVPKFQQPAREFCDYLMLKRNEEVHTCELPFEAMAEAQWLPHYYEVCSTLNEYVGHTLADYFGADEAAVADELIKAKDSAKRGDVERRVAQHRAAFAGLTEERRRTLVEVQEAASIGWPHPASGTNCPACGCRALMIGRLERSSDPMFRDGALVVQEIYLTTSLSCAACGLELHDVSEVHWGGVEPHYERVVHTDLHEFYEPEDFDAYMNM